MDENTALYIQRYYDGDEKRYRYESANVDRHATSWNDIEKYNACDDGKKRFAHNASFWRLGFQPSESIMIFVMPNLCELMDRFMIQDEITWEKFKKLFDARLKWVRKEHLFRNGWLDNLDLTEKNIEHYHTFKPYMKETARRYLIDVLGYDPELRSSLFAELTIRNVLSKGAFDDLHSHTQLDLRHQTITVVKYLERLYSQGRKAADALPHYGFNWTDDIWPERII